MSKCGPTKITGHEPINGTLNVTKYDPLNHSSAIQEGGLTIRQYFAAQALTGVMSVSNFDYIDENPRQIAGRAIIIADELIDLLNKTA